MTRRAPVLAAILYVLAAPSGTETAFGQPAPAPDVDATFTIAFADGRSTYQVGELIPLVLEFTGRAGPEYSFSTVSGRRSGSFATERYVVTAAAAVADPLAEYLSSFAFAGSVLGSSHPLGGSVLRLTAHLNEWIRFDRAGEYELVVTSSRLERRPQSTRLEMRSNPLCSRRFTRGGVVTSGFLVPEMRPSPGCWRLILRVRRGSRWMKFEPAGTESRLTHSPPL